MLPSYNNSLVGQQGLSQQALNQPSLVDQQQQQQGIPGVPNRDDALMWRGFQNQHQHLQFRPPVGGDMGGAQVHNTQVSLSCQMPPLPSSLLEPRAMRSLSLPRPKR